MGNKSVTFLCDKTILDNLQEFAKKDFDGNLSLQIRKVLKNWNEQKN